MTVPDDRDNGQRETGARETADRETGAPGPLRPLPPVARRLNRNALTVAAALAGVTVLTVLVVANPSRSRAGSAAPTAAAVDPAPPTPAQPTFLDEPPKAPAAPSPPPAPSPVPPPLPGATPDPSALQYGAPAPSQIGTMQSPGAPSVRWQAYQAALMSAVMVKEVSQGEVSPHASAPSSSDSTMTTPPGVLPVVAPHVRGSDSTPVTLRPAGSPYTVRAGTLIPGLLITGVSSDLPGGVIGQTSRDVFDTRTERLLLIPKGSRLIGTYDNRSVGTGRLIVSWTRLLFPDGRSLTLPRLLATDALGQSGMHDEVNHHYGRIYGTALLMSIISAGAQLSQPQQGGLYASLSARQVAAGALGQQLSDVALESARRGLDIPPTITIRPGQPFNVFLTGDVTLDGPYVPEP